MYGDAGSPAPAESGPPHQPATRIVCGQRAGHLRWTAEVVVGGGKGGKMKPGFRARLIQTATKPNFIWIPLPDTNYAPYRADSSLPRVVRMRFGADMEHGCATRAARSDRHRPRVA